MDEQVTPLAALSHREQAARRIGSIAEEMVQLDQHLGTVIRRYTEAQAQAEKLGISFELKLSAPMAAALSVWRNEQGRRVEAA
jgi:hypothetical protein